MTEHAAATHPTPTDRRPNRRMTSGRVLAASGAAVLLAVGLGCSSTSSTETAGSTTAAPATTATGGSRPGTAGTTYPEGGKCLSRMPGEILTADEAVVRFTPSQICPGYVTVAPGTPVTFKNNDTASHVVTITEGTSGTGKTVATATVAAGKTWAQSSDTPGSSTFVIDAIPSFRGTIEVVGGAMQH